MSCFPSLFHSVTVSQFFFFMTCGMYSNLRMSDIFLMIRLGLFGYFERIPLRRRLVPSHRLSVDMWYPYDDANLHYLDKVVFAKFLYWKYTIFFPFLTLIFGSKSLSLVCPHWGWEFGKRELELRTTRRRENVWNSIWKFVVFLSFFIFYLCNHLYLNGLIYLIVWVIIQCYVIYFDA